MTVIAPWTYVFEIGRRLAAAWTHASHSSRHRIGQLLADGWTDPLYQR